MTPDAQRIWGILSRHVGPAAAISAGQIARALEMADGTTVRAIVAENYRKFAAPIGGCGKGLYIISPADPTGGEAADHYRRRLLHHIGEMERRLLAFEEKMRETGWLQSSAGHWYRPRQARLFDTTRAVGR